MVQTKKETNCIGIYYKRKAGKGIQENGIGTLRTDPPDL